MYYINVWIRIEKLNLANTPRTHTGFFAKRGGGGILSSRKKQFIYIICSSHDRETVEQISDENLTNYVSLSLYKHYSFYALIRIGIEGPKLEKC